MEARRVPGVYSGLGGRRGGGEGVLVLRDGGWAGMPFSQDGPSV